MSSFIIRNESTAALAAMLDRSVNAARMGGVFLHIYLTYSYNVLTVAL